MSGVILVTGGSRGVGGAICRAAANRGYKVGINFRQSERLARLLADAIRAEGGTAVAIQGDITIEQDIIRVFSELDGSLGRITALVNNAGGGIGSGPIHQASIPALQAVMALNLIGPILCAREAVKRMSTSEGGLGA